MNQKMMVNKGWAMDVQDAFKNLNPIALFAGCVLPMVATPIGIIVAYLVRRMMPMVNILTTIILAGYIVNVVILFALIRRVFSESTINIYGAAVTSLIIATGVVFLLAYVVRRKLLVRQPEREAALKEEQTFSVYGEDMRDRTKKLHRKR